MREANGNRPVGDVESQGLPGGIVHHRIVPLQGCKRGVRTKAASPLLLRGSYKEPPYARAWGRAGSSNLTTTRLAHPRSPHQQVQNPGREGLEAGESNPQVFQQPD